MYAHELLGGGAPDQAVAAHLAWCEDCRAVLDELLDVTRAAAQPDEPAPTIALDLSRLTRPWSHALSADRPWYTDQQQRLWLELTPALLRSWQSGPLVGASRGALLYRFQQSVSPPDPGLHLTIFSEESADLALLALSVELADGDPLDQSGVAVDLYLDGMQRQAVTDGAGSVQFEHLPRAGLSRLRLAITVDQQP